jgi:lysophospholipase L1-like esterase
MRRASAAGLLAAALVAAAATAGTAAADPINGSDANGTYLALGDSVPFGYQPAAAVPAPTYRIARSFVGYPELVGQALDERVSNAACPGETTASMVTAGAQSNGCENSVNSPVGYRTLYPLHVQYQGTQLDYALHYLAAHKHTRLITIMIGANDAFVCQETTLDHCTSGAELVGVATQIETNLATALGAIRAAGYTGPLVAVTYYSLSYSDPAQLAGALFLNSALTTVAQAFGGIVADGFGAFAAGSAPFGGSPCAAGLLIKLPGGGCDVHPTLAGHRLLAAAVLQALGS